MGEDVEGFGAQIQSQTLSRQLELPFNKRRYIVKSASHDRALRRITAPFTTGRSVVVPVSPLLVVPVTIL
jgi:hypothetical protein